LQNRLIEKLKAASKILKREIIIYKNVMRDDRTPLLAKILLGMAIGYLLMPFDLIPDFIPVIGQLDDIIIVPLLFYSAIKIIPENIIEEHRISLTEDKNFQ
jgi:uncharacterized membrane protein YkvA (DUF1232 family)